jgi:hypothetical protein
MTSGSDDDEAAGLATRRGEALEVLGSSLASAGFRLNFLDNPQLALESVDIAPDVLPDEFIDGLRELSTTELRLIAEITKLLSDMELGGGQFPF